MHQLEGLGDRAAAGEHAVIAQNHDELVAEVGDQALALVEIERDALVVMVGEAIGELHRPLIERQQSLLLTGHRDAGDGVGVQHADRVGPRRVHGAVNGEAGRIDAEAQRVVDDVAVDIDGDQVGRRHLFETQAVGIDQETVMAAGEPDRDVGVDAVVETEPVDQPVGGGEIDPGLLGFRPSRPEAVRALSLSE